MDTTGVVLPRVNGKRSSTTLGRLVVVDALEATDPVGAASARRETNWRNRYAEHLRRAFEAGLVSEDAAVRIARDGLASLHRRMLVSDGEDEVPLDEVFDAAVRRPLHTETISGNGERVEELAIPVGGEMLSQGRLQRQLDAWVKEGSMEPDAAHAIREVVRHPEWLSMPGKKVAVLGATAEMGPLRALLSWGAEVVALDLPRPELWKTLLPLAAESGGVMHYPVHEPGDERSAGVDLLTDLAAAHAWLSGFGGELVLGNYVYADGVTNLRVSMASDALAVRMLADRDDISLAYLATPTDVFGVPANVVEASADAYDHRALRVIRPLLKAVSGGKLLRRNYPRGEDPGVIDAIIPQQGPNYLLAKRLQRWRATVARRDGAAVSMHVAPPTKTSSVTKSRVLAAAYGGAHHFGVHVFEPATSNHLMAVLLIHDTYAGTGELREPWREEAEKAIHGGLWRGPYAPRSALGLALTLGAGATRP